MGILPLSVVIITRNEEANIERCILSVQPICNNIVVVDSGSTDNTIKIAQGLGAEVIKRPWEGYSKQKNMGNAAAKHHFIFSLDADEVFSPALCQELTELFAQGNLKPLYKVNRINHFAKKPIRHGAWYPDFHYRLFDRRLVSWAETDDVHEELSYTANTPKEILKQHLDHFTTETEAFYLEKMDKYAHLFASKMAKKGKKASILKAYSSATFRFIREYIFQLGFLDGTAGLIIAKAHYTYTRNKYLYLRKLILNSEF